VAPIAAARLTAAARLLVLGLLASTSRMWQLGHTADTASRSSAISPPQPESAAGYEPATPLWFTFLKQPLAVVQAGSPKCDRYIARSDSALGRSYASTIATVWSAP